jgi:hypothetical protein
MRQLVRIIGVLALAVVLSACSAIKLGYNSLTDVAYWWLDGYFDFSDTQAPRVREDLARLHAWHRANELPRLAEMLARMEQLAPGPVTAAQACGFVGEAQERLTTALAQAEPAAVVLAADLAPRQLRHLQRKYEDNNRNYRKEWIDLHPVDRADKRFKQALERIEMIYGRLDEPQRAVLRQAVADSVFDPQRILAERQRRQQDLLQTLRKLHGPAVPAADARALLRGYLERVVNSPNPAYRQYQQALVEEGCRTFAAVHESTTPEQRQQAVRRLRAYQRDLRELAAPQ